MMSNGLKPYIVEKINNIFIHYPQIEKVILYGSRAKGNYKTGSDIDLTIISKDIDIILLHRIENDLDDLLLPYIIDISIFKHIKNDNLLDHIDRIGLEFYVKKP